MNEDELSRLGYNSFNLNYSETVTRHIRPDGVFQYHCLQPSQQYVSVYDHSVACIRDTDIISKGLFGISTYSAFYYYAVAYS